jgi:hypothetical protein
MTRSSRGKPVYRVQVYDAHTGRTEGWATRNGPPFANGAPRWIKTSGRCPEGLWPKSVADGIAGGFNRIMGTRSRIRARVLKDRKAAGEQQQGVRQPTGEAA